MTSTYSTNLKLTLMGTGDQSGTWGDTTNTNLGTLVEEAIAGYTTQALTGAGPTALTIPDGATSVGRNYVIEFTGTPTAGHTVTVPAVDKPYILFNNTNIALIVKVSGQTGITIAVGKKAIAYTNSTDVIEVANAPVTEAGTQTLTNKTLTSPTIATPTITTSATVPLVIGGTAVSSALTLQSTSGVGTSDSIVLKVGNNGATTAMTANTSGNIEFRAGTAALPALTTTGDTNTGIFFPAADTIAFTEGGAEAMRINSSGNVGIGETNPTRKLDVVGTASATYFMMSSNTASAPAVDAAITRPADGTLAVITNSAERMRIDSSGNVGIGETTPRAPLAFAATVSTAGLPSKIRLYDNGISNLYGFGVSSGQLDIVSGTGANIAFWNNSGSNQNMTIDSSGNLLVGSSSSVGTKLYVTSSNDTSFFNTSGTTTTCSYWKVGSNSGCYYSLFQNTSGSNIGWIRTTDGSTVQYYTGSDRRLKENIVDAAGGLSTVSNLKVRSYDWKMDGKHVEYGFIAQELAEVAPDAVSVGVDKEDGSIDVPWGVDYAKLVPILVAAIQELKAQNDELKARITALEVTP